MVVNDGSSTDTQALLLQDETLWLDRVPPELECDESELSLVVQELIGSARTGGDA
jgi:hypothetical protein